MTMIVLVALWVSTVILAVAVGVWVGIDLGRRDFALAADTGEAVPWRDEEFLVVSMTEFDAAEKRAALAEAIVVNRVSISEEVGHA